MWFDIEITTFTTRKNATRHAESLWFDIEITTFTTSAGVARIVELLWFDIEITTFTTGRLKDADLFSCGLI